MVDDLEACIAEGRDDQALWFVLQEQELFYQTGYKALQGRSGKGFIPCYRLLYNGKVKLTYDIAGYKTFKAILPELAYEQIGAVFAAIFEAAASVQDNGFIRYDDISIGADKIFLNTHNQVSLVYLPLKPSKYEGSFSEFEARLRKSLADALRICRVPLDGLLTAVCNELEDPSYTMQEIEETLAKGTVDKSQSTAKSEGEIEADAKRESTLGSKRKGPLGFFKKKAPSDKAETPQLPERQTFSPELTLESIEPIGLSLKVDKAQYFIGKNPHTVNGLIENSNAVSRTHCKIEWQEGGYTLTDVGSINGTFLNEMRLTSGSPVGIKIGDHIKIANVTFKVVAS